MNKHPTEPSEAIVETVARAIAPYIFYQFDGVTQERAANWNKHEEKDREHMREIARLAMKALDPDFATRTDSQWEGPAYEYGVTWGPESEHPDRRTDTDAVELLRRALDAGHEWVVDAANESKGEGDIVFINAMRDIKLIERALASLTPSQSDPIEQLLRDIRDGALIYWEPQTSRGMVAKTEFIARINEALTPSQSTDAVERTGRALVAKLDEILPIIDGMIALQTARGYPYTGPNLAAELADFRAALTPSQSDCPSCGGQNTSCPDGCGLDPKTGELNGTRLSQSDPIEYCGWVNDPDKGGE